MIYRSSVFHTAAVYLLPQAETVGGTCWDEVAAWGITPRTVYELILKLIVTIKSRKGAKPTRVSVK